MRASGEIFLALNGSSVTVQISTRKNGFDLKLIRWLHSLIFLIKRAHTPYFYACESSIDRMKKMVCLEEHGWILSHDDIVTESVSTFCSNKI